MTAIESNGYNVFFDAQLEELLSFIQRAKYSKVFVLTDRNTTEHCLPFLQDVFLGKVTFDLIEVDPGEENKNIDFCIGVWKTLMDFGADRKSLLINLGGGVITDMGGFAASTFKRGLDFVQVPTTLLSQVDASVGGKTGIDMDGVKNIIGTFTQPKAVFMRVAFLSSLAARQKRSGFAEMVKHGLILDEPYFNRLAEGAEEAYENPDAAMIRHSVNLKNSVVMEDPEEAGLRKILNFGHTVGHAIESYSLNNDSFPLLHGEAIAIGMVVEAYLSHIHNGLPADALNRIVAFLMEAFPVYSFGEGIYEELISLMLKDKKNSNGQISFALLARIGKCDVDCFLQEDSIRKGLDFYRTAVELHKPADQ